MKTSRRIFLRQFAGVVPALIGGTQLAGCLGESGSDEPTSQQLAVSETGTQTVPSASAAPMIQPAPTTPAPQPLNSGPVWQPSPTIEFVEGMPAMVSVRQFVSDPDQDPLVLQLKSGTLLPGITWNPDNATIAYDGRPLGAKPEQSIVVSGVTFSADDGKS
jgi:hypothetical protein